MPDISNSDESPFPVIGELSKYNLHYELAYGLIPHLAFSIPKELIVMLSPESPIGSERYIQNMIDFLCKELPNAERTFNAKDVRVEFVTINSRPSVVFEFPEPQFITGAYLAVFVTDMKPRNQENQKAVSSPLVSRYFTLERSTQHDNGKTTTVFGEFTADREHKNLGEGSKPNQDDFCRLVLSFLDAESN